MLRSIEMTTVIKDDTLWITAPEVAESTLETRVYDVSDLVCRDDASDSRPAGLPAVDRCNHDLPSADELGRGGRAGIDRAVPCQRHRRGRRVTNGRVL